MRIEDVEYEILLGLAEGERPADLLYLCHSVAASCLAHGRDFHVRRPYASDREHIVYRSEPGRRVRLLFGAGLLLCPIFDPVKHQEYSEYTSQMTTVRLSYAGIATNPELKMAFGRGVETAISKGSFESLQTADGTQLWRILRRSDGGYERLS